MRTGISITLGSSDRLRLEAMVGDCNAAQKNVWRAAIILFSADGLGTHAIMRRTGKSCDTPARCLSRGSKRAEAETRGIGRQVMRTGVAAGLLGVPITVGATETMADRQGG